MRKTVTGDVSRRFFLGQAAGGLCGAAALLTGGAGQEKPAPGPAKPAAAPEPGPAKPEPYDPEKHEYAYLIDIAKCIGCGACVRACEKENKVPPHYFRTWIERYRVSRAGHVDVESPNGGRDGFEPKVTGFEITKGFFVPKLCNQCTFTPCIQLCPVGASYRTPDGVVLVDEKRCIGCGYCVQACPYGSRFIHPGTHTASKCTLCYHRITRGLKPACVQACPAGVRQIGDRRKPDDPVAAIIATKEIHVLKPEMLTEPNCCYLGMSREVR